MTDHKQNDNANRELASTTAESGNAAAFAAEEMTTRPLKMLAERGDRSIDRGEYDNAIADYADVLESCHTDGRTPPLLIDQIQQKLQQARNCLRWTLTAGGDPEHHLIPDEARDPVRNASLPNGYLLTIDSQVILEHYPSTPEGCREATRVAEVTAFDVDERNSLKSLAGRDDFDLVIYACEGQRATQVCRTQALRGPGFQDALDGLLVVFRQLNAPVPSCWRPGLRWQAEAHSRWDERYHAIGMCWVCDPESVKSPGERSVGYGPSVDYLFVLDGWRRNGIAAALIDACRKRWPDLSLGAGATDEGEAFLNAYAASHPECMPKSEARAQA